MSMTTIEPAKVEDWPIDPRFPGTAIPTPEALVKAAKTTGFKIRRLLGAWLVPTGDCGCAAGAAYALCPPDLRKERVLAPSGNGCLAISERLGVPVTDGEPLIVGHISNGFESGSRNSLPALWGREVFELYFNKKHD